MQELVTLVPWTFVAQICNLFIQVYLIKRFLFKPVMEILEKRRQITDEQLSEAKEASEKALSMKADYEKNLAEANANAKEILQTAKHQAELQSEAIVKDAQKEATSLRQKADADIAQERLKAFNEMKDEIGDIAVEIAGKVIGREVDASDHERLIDDVINQMG